ncbi:unnamed protein product [Nippostrongylus brasiliensis]|uniref:Uncharacterized protein n=1 Tax=Nippostrongylus brasiliensis TaxID=27835 RepID=A0A0N4XXG3_NIPBR|nr:unnamed protein product [Nippostrongylus brasiliensis]
MYEAAEILWTDERMSRAKVPLSISTVLHLADHPLFRVVVSLRLDQATVDHTLSLSSHINGARTFLTFNNSGIISSILAIYLKGGGFNPTHTVIDEGCSPTLWRIDVMQISLDL